MMNSDIVTAPRLTSSWNYILLLLQDRAYQTTRNELSNLCLMIAIACNRLNSNVSDLRKKFPSFLDCSEKKTTINKKI